MEIHIFFSRHKKQGREIGNTALNLVRSSLGVSDLPFSQVNVPSDFYSDLYIKGFFISYITALIDHGVGGSNWSKERQGECAVEAMLVLDPSGQFKEDFINLSMDMSNYQRIANEPLYSKGANDAVTLVGVAYNLLPADDPDPILQEAKELVPKISKNLSQTESEAVSAAVALLTISKYVRDKWE